MATTASNVEKTILFHTYLKINPQKVYRIYATTSIP